MRECVTTVQSFCQLMWSRNFWNRRLICGKRFWRRAGVRTSRQPEPFARQTRLFLYSLKVGFALAVSLLMLFVLPGAGSRSPDPELYFLEDTHRSITEKLKEGSDKVDLLLDHLAGWSVFMEYEEE